MRGRTERDVFHGYVLRARERVGLYDFDNLVAVYSPTWSPGSRQLAFTGIDKGGWADLYTYDRESDALRRLTRDTYDDRDPDWSPDGSRIVFSSDRTAVGEHGAYNLFPFDLETASINYVTYGEHMDPSPRVSPDGSHIVFASARRQPDCQFHCPHPRAAGVTGWEGEGAGMWLGGAGGKCGGEEGGVVVRAGEGGEGPVLSMERGRMGVWACLRTRVRWMVRGMVSGRGETGVWVWRMLYCRPLNLSRLQTHRWV